MLKFILVILFYNLISCLPLIAKGSDDSSYEKITHVIYITLDGVRWQDIFRNPDAFQKLKSNPLAGKFYGMPGSNTSMEVATVPLCLPSYQSQMAGRIIPTCIEENCPRINVATLVENVIEKMHLRKRAVAIFSSWPKINLAVEHIPDKVYANTGNIDAFDPETRLSDAMMAKYNREQSGDYPIQVGKHQRYDKYTFAQALHYFKKYQPLFMWISFSDAENAAHQRNLQGYYQALAYYDEVIQQIIETLKILKIEKNTLVIVTTDHGRGNGPLWTEHGPEFPESKKTWAFVINADLIPIEQNGKIRHYNTLSIKPTIEKALGIKP